MGRVLIPEEMKIIAQKLCTVVILVGGLWFRVFSGDFGVKKMPTPMEKYTGNPFMKFSVSPNDFLWEKN